MIVITHFSLKKKKFYLESAFLFFTVAYNKNFRSKPSNLLQCYPLSFFIG